MDLARVRDSLETVEGEGERLFSKLMSNSESENGFCGEVIDKQEESVDVEREHLQLRQFEFLKCRLNKKRTLVN